MMPDGVVETDIYRKPTDTMNYVPFDSAHPKHVLRNIPYNLARRIKMIVSNTNTRQERYMDLEKRLLELKYPPTLVKDAIVKANRDNVVPESNHLKVVPFVQDFNKNNPRIYENTIRPLTTSFNVLHSFRDIKFIPAFRQPRSIVSLLRYNNRITIYGVRKCNEPRCKCCEILICGSTLEFNTSRGKTIFNIRSNMDCRSSNVIYKLVCSGCSAYYIGQTGDPLRTRMTVHRQQIAHENYSILEVSRHIRLCGGEFTIAPFYLLSPESSRLQRESKESMFISKFHPQLNSV
jgi:hypothetical protein